jgi:hypothetical protein
MKITFRVHMHTHEEIQMGHKLGFTGIAGVDAVSATANEEGFTPLNAAVRAYGWDRDLIAETSIECNKRQETAILNYLTPTLLLVPRLVGKLSYKYTVEGCAIDLLLACKHLKIKRLHFTHFGFMQSFKARQYFVKILEIFMNPLIQIPIEELIWEIDFRGLRALQAAYHEVRIRFHLPEEEPKVIFAEQFKYGEPIVVEGGYSWREFIPSDL